MGEQSHNSGAIIFLKVHLSHKNKNMVTNSGPILYVWNQVWSFQNQASVDNWNIKNKQSLWKQIIFCS